MKRLVFLIYLASLFMGCALGKDKSLDEGALNLVNPDQTNAVESGVTVMSVEAAKEVATQEAFHLNWHKARGPVLIGRDMEKVKTVEWGPVIFVENEQTDSTLKYYYIFTGKMPDGSLPIRVVVDAETGKIGDAEFQNFRGPQIYYMTADEAKSYICDKLSINTNDFSVKAVLISQETNTQPAPICGWTYKLTPKNDSQIVTKAFTANSVYVSPVIYATTNETPSPRNTLSRIRNYPHRLFIDQQTKSGDSKPSIYPID